MPINPVERPGTPRSARQILNRLNEVSFNAEWEFLAMLRDEGRRAAEVFLAEHGDALGHRSSMDLDILLREV